MEYIINNKRPGIFDEYEKEGKNTAQLVVRDKTGKEVPHEYRVELSLSKNALLGLGKSLIRRIIKKQNNGIYHFYPIKPGNHDIVQTLGLLIAPDSSEPIVDFWEVGQIDKDIPKLKTKSEEINPLPMHYEFNINSDRKTPEDFELAWDNIARFRVFDHNNHDISDKCQYIELGLSNDASLGFGTELIRLAHNFEEGKEIHIKPASKKHGAQQEMGVFLTPDSCELVIKCETFKPIETYLEEYKKNHQE